MFKSIANIFGGPAATPAANAAPAANPVDPNVTKPAATPGPDGSVQLENKGATKEQKQQNPLDPFADLWEPPKQEGEPGNGKPPQTQTPPKSPDYVAAAKKIDFSRLVPPELATKALGGDTTAFSQILNTIGQSGFAAAGKMTEGMIAKAIEKARAEIDSSLSGRFKELAVSNTRSKNPNMQHKAVRPMVEAIKSQMSLKFPDASPEEIQAKSEDYVAAMLAAANSGSSSSAEEETDPLKEKAKAQANQTYDWDKYALGDNVSS
jgi:hypothetical protein